MEASVADGPESPAAKGAPEAETLDEPAVLGRLLGLGVEQHTESPALGVEPGRESTPDLQLLGPLTTGSRAASERPKLTPKAALGKRTGSGEEKHRVLGVKRSQREEPHKEREPEPLAGAELGRDKPEATEGARLGVEEGRESPPDEEALVLLLGAARVPLKLTISCARDLDTRRCPTTTLPDLSLIRSHVPPVRSASGHSSSFAHSLIMTRESSSVSTPATNCRKHCGASSLTVTLETTDETGIFVVIARLGTGPACSLSWEQTTLTTSFLRLSLSTDRHKRLTLHAFTGNSAFLLFAFTGDSAFLFRDQRNGDGSHTLVSGPQGLEVGDTFSSVTQD